MIPFADRYRFWSKVNKLPDGDACWLWTGLFTKDGYGRFFTGKKYRLAHVVSWIYVHEKEPLENILHTCDNPPCVNPKHLFEGSDLENARDKETKRRGNHNGPQGEKQTHSRLTDDQVREIRSSGLTGRELAAKFLVSTGTISLIRSRDRWSHVQ